MRRSINNLPLSIKLPLTTLVFVLALVGLSCAAYFGLSRQKNITGEFLNTRFKNLEQYSTIAGDLARINGNVNGVLGGIIALNDAERSKALQEQTAAIGSVLQSMQAFSVSGSFLPEEQKAYLAVVEGVKSYEQAVEQASRAVKITIVLKQRFLGSANERFAMVLLRLKLLQDTEKGRGRETYERSLGVYSSTVAVLLALLTASVFLIILINTFLIRRAIIAPIKSLEQASGLVTQGDLSFDVKTKNRDEIGRTADLLKKFFSDLESVLERIKELSGRIHNVVEEVEKNTGKVLVRAETETDAISSISSAVEELNTTVDEISGNTEGLVSSAETASASIEQMAQSIESINNNIQELNKLVASTTVSIEQLSSAIQAVAADSAKLEGASEETITSIAQIAMSIREVKAHAEESASLSEQVTQEAATLGLDAIMKTIDGMKEISSSVHAAAAGIQTLGNRSQEIEMIINVIETVNEEMNLLSLNAAILAAEAGEQGKGFSVVAKTIKDLSDQTERKTKEIATLIQAVQRDMADAESMVRKGIPAVEEGTRLAKAGEEALRKILESSRRASEMTLSIQRATEEQAKTAAFVNEATGRVKKMIDDIAKTTVAQSREVALISKAAESMKALSGQVSSATGEQAKTSGHIAEVTERVYEISRQVASALGEHRTGSRSILNSIDMIKDIPMENRDLAVRITKTLWNLQKDVELLGVEMERFTFRGTTRQALRFGVVPLKEPQEMFRKFKPLTDYLAGKLGRKVDLKVAIDMESAVKDLGENITQICAMGPVNYVKAYKKYGVAVIAKALRKGKSFHQAAILVRKEAPFNSVQDLAGKRFAFGNVGSATGHIMPLAMLKVAGINPEDLGDYQFMGDHDTGAEALLEGKYDAAGTIAEIAERYLDKGLRILALSTEIPEFNICCHPSVDEQTRDLVSQSLIALNPSNPEEARILGSLGRDCTGFTTAFHSEYDVFREEVLSVADAIEAEERGWHRG